MKIIPEIMQECVKQVASHYRQKMEQRGINPTEAELKQAIESNWVQISREASKLYVMTYNELKKKAAA